MGMKISKKDVFIFILAGGKGTRFWPLSRKNTPKQFLCIYNSRSMLQNTYRRFKSLISVRQIFIICPHSQINQIKKQLPDFDKNNFIIEPQARGTAAAIGLATAIIRRKNPKGIMVIAPADQYVEGARQFKDTLNKAIESAVKYNQLVTIGIKPSYPSTGYGYLKFGQKLKVESGTAYKIDRLIEKPSKKKALRFIGSKRYYFNSGMFIWKVDIFLKELRIHMRSLYKNLLKIDKLRKTYLKKNFKKVNSIYKKIKPISIDYGLMEKTGNIIGVKATFKWTDLGSLKSLDEIYTKKGKSNVVIGALNITDNSRGCIIYGEGNHLIATIGIKELIVVVTKDITLVVHKKDAQKIKDIVNRISKNKKFKKFI